MRGVPIRVGGLSWVLSVLLIAFVDPAMFAQTRTPLGSHPLASVYRIGLPAHTETTVTPEVIVFELQTATSSVRRVRTGCAAVAIIVVALAGGGLFAAAVGPGSLSIWWTAWLNLRSLSDVNQALRARVPNSGLELGPTADDPTAITPNTCEEYLAAIEKGLFASGINDQKIQAPFVARCYTLRYLERARPARVSYLTKPLWSAQPLSDLPPLPFRMELSGEREVDRALARGMSWQQFDPDAKAEDPSEDGIVVKDGGFLYSFMVLAHGDFNNDGIEDFALSCDIRANGRGPFGTSVFYILTRLKPGETMRLLTERQPPYRLAFLANRD